MSRATPQNLKGEFWGFVIDLALLQGKSLKILIPPKMSNLMIPV